MNGEPFAKFSPGQVGQLAAIVKDFHWMAQRYADGRMSYVSKLFNDHTNTLLNMGVDLRPIDGSLYATDGMGRQFDGLEDSEARLIHIAEMDRRLAEMFSVYLQTQMGGDIHDPVCGFPRYLQQTYEEWKNARGYNPTKP